jgi:hypothetical protein
LGSARRRRGQSIETGARTKGKACPGQGLTYISENAIAGSLRLGQVEPVGQGCGLLPVRASLLHTYSARDRVDDVVVECVAADGT